MSAIMERPTQEILHREKIIEYLNAFGFSDLNEREKTQFVEIAQAYNLNPFKREIHCVAYGTGNYRTLSIIVGYEVYLKRAERSGKLDGWNVEIKGSLQPTKFKKKKWDKNKNAHVEYEVNSWAGDLSAVITIHRTDRKHPIVHEVFFDEYNGQTDIWNSKPRSQIRKVAISQGFRLAFPDELAGLPYTQEEHDSFEPINVTPEGPQEPRIPQEAEKRESTLAPIPPVEMDEPSEIIEIRQALADAVIKKITTQSDADMTMQVAKTKHGVGLSLYKDKVLKRIGELLKEVEKAKEAAKVEETMAPALQEFEGEIVDDSKQLDIF